MTTKFNAQALRETASGLGRIMDEASAFTPLRASWPSIGGFDVARELEAVVDDRRRAVLAHAAHLKALLDDMDAALTRIATGFEAVDTGNARRMGAALGDGDGGHHRGGPAGA
ncbi:hypothetical protein AB0I60_23100 [Actinosynnema sp. NPDC050436]|uniref:hypothetical protein n=1 Tax=Actinosynnema sp. NPDC050436 TaxID=3155659 RepID=UPI0033F1AD82